MKNSIIILSLSLVFFESISSADTEPKQRTKFFADKIIQNKNDNSFDLIGNAKIKVASENAHKGFDCLVSIPDDGGKSEILFGQSKAVNIRNSQTGKSVEVRMELAKFEKVGEILNIEVRDQGKQVINSAVDASAPYFSFNLMPSEIGMAIDCWKKK